MPTLEETRDRLHRAIKIYVRLASVPRLSQEKRDNCINVLEEIVKMLYNEREELEDYLS